MQDYIEPKWLDCAVCGEKFDASARNRGRGRHRYCSPKCRQKADNLRHYKRYREKTAEELTRECVICGLRFVTDAHHPNALTCSQPCNQARMDRVRRQKRAKNKDLSPKSCEECGELYTPSIHVAHKQKYCSKRCQNRSTQRRHKRGYDRRLRSLEWKEASQKAKERDGHKCVFCAEDRKRLSVHHVFHLTDEEMHDHSLENLITLCNACHKQTHDIRVGREGGEIVVSGKIFDFLGADKVKVIPSQ